MVPIGRGQRELIIGDRQTGKTAVAVDTIISQKGKGVTCVRRHRPEGVDDQQRGAQARRARRAGIHHRRGRLGLRLGRHAVPGRLRRLHDGRVLPRSRRDALIVYDDLTKQAWAYRQVSLRCAVRRAAKPTRDVFYLHCACSSVPLASTKSTSRSSPVAPSRARPAALTALPIIETQAGDVSAFVPTNVISITDGQIFLETDLFNAGASGHQRRYLGVPRRRRRPDQGRQEAVRRYPYRPGPVP